MSTSAAVDIEFGLVPISPRSVHDVFASPENDRLYRPVDPEDPAVVALAAAVAADGVLEPLVVTSDGYLLSGHRRHAAARLAGLEAVPCRVVPFRRGDDPNRFLRLLREFNRQRVKTRDEQLREAVVDVNPEEEYEALWQYRRDVEASAPATKALAIEG